MRPSDLIFCITFIKKKKSRRLRRERHRREEKLEEIDTRKIQEVERMILKYTLRKKGQVLSILV
jgi:hypothetical protein